MKTCTATRLGILFVILLGLVRAQSQQALQDAQAAIERKDYATALRTVQPLVQRGDPAAQTFLGSMQAQGHGVLQSYTESAN